MRIGAMPGGKTQAQRVAGGAQPRGALVPMHLNTGFACRIHRRCAVRVASLASLAAWFQATSKMERKTGSVKDSRIKTTDRTGYAKRGNETHNSLRICARRALSVSICPSSDSLTARAEAPKTKAFRSLSLYGPRPGVKRAFVLLTL